MKLLIMLIWHYEQLFYTMCGTRPIRNRHLLHIDVSQHEVETIRFYILYVKYPERAIYGRGIAIAETRGCVLMGAACKRYNCPLYRGKKSKKQLKYFFKKPCIPKRIHIY